MEKMQNPELKVVRFSAEDVIATSGMLSLVTLSGFGDGDNAGNNTWTVGSTTYRMDTDSFADLQDALETYGDGAGDQVTPWYVNSDLEDRLNNLWNKDNDGWGAFNGSYSWNGEYWYKISN